jgi:hypothetical protein
VGRSGSRPWVLCTTYWLKRCLFQLDNRQMVMKFRRATSEDFSAILEVQAANFIGNLNDAARQNGFLSVEFTREQIEEMADHVGIIVARDETGVAGYLCASACEFNRSFPLIADMMQQFNRIDYRGRSLTSYRVFIYGPVCIDRPYRGQGLLRGLYETLKQEVAGPYDVGVAFVAEDNPHSFRAHVDGLGMDRVGEFLFDAKRYHILAFGVCTERHRQAHPDD